MDTAALNPVELRELLAQAETRELAALALESLHNQIAEVDKRRKRLEDQLAELRSRRQELVSDRDARILRGVEAGVAPTKLASAAGVAPTWVGQLSARSKAPATADDAPSGTLFKTEPAA